jgi:hypothetical protein
MIFSHFILMCYVSISCTERSEGSRAAQRSRAILEPSSLFLGERHRPKTHEDEMNGNHNSDEMCLLILTVKFI